MSTYSRTASPPSSNPFLTSLLQSLAVMASVIALGALTFFIVLGIFQGMYANRIYPGVTFWGVELGSQTRAEARDRMTQRFIYPQAGTITLRDGGRSWTLTPGQLGLRFDVDATVEQAYSIGRTGQWLPDIQTQFDTWYEGGADIRPVVVFNRTQAERALRQIAAEIDRPPVEATLDVRGTEVIVTPGEFGRTVDVEATLAVLEQSLTSLTNFDQALVVVEYRPNILDASAQADLARRILSQPLEIRPGTDLNDPQVWTFAPETLGQMLTFRPTTGADGSVTYSVGIDDVQLRGFLESIAPQVARTPENARFIFNDETRQLEIIRPAVIGRSLNIEASIEIINTTLAQGGHQAALSFDLQPPEVGDSATAAELGITGLISSQTSYYAGSSESRINNITTGSDAFHGVLIPPGGTFSFNEILGDISLDSGFSEALIIYGGRTIKGVGGGICQVSTTVFRAAYYGGFPITSRIPHAYRVAYYEQGGFGPGLDATIFSPVVDFQFTNDRPGWLLVEVYYSVANRWLQFKFYGAQDGRNVQVGTPIIRNVVPHGDPVWEENPELAPGEVKQVDWAADGMDVVVQRTITMPDGQVLQDNLNTHYQPWRAVCQYGPGTDFATLTNLPGQCVPPGVSDPNSN